MLVPKSTTLAAAFALIAMLANGVSATLTKFDTEYDYRVIRYKWSLKVIGDLVALQNGPSSVWLQERFDNIITPLIEIIDAGEITRAAYDEEIAIFLRSTKQKYSDFDEAVSIKLKENQLNPFRFVEVAPESWSDVYFYLLRETAKDLEMTALEAEIATLEEEVEADIKAKETGANINARLNAFIALKVTKAFGNQIEKNLAALMDKVDEQDKNPDPVTKAPSTTEPPLTSAPTTEPSLSGSSSASASSSGSAAPRNTTAPAPAPSGANSIGVVATAAAVFAVALSAMF